MNSSRASSHTPLIRSFGLVFFGNMCAAGLGALCVWFASRYLTISGFGLFSLGMAVLRSLPTVTTFGLDTSTMKFASAHLRDGEDSKAVQAMRAAFSLRLWAGLILSGCVYLAAEPLSRGLFHSPEFAPILRIVSAGVLSASMFNYLKSVFWSYQLFKKSVILQLIVDGSRFVATAVFALTSILTPGLAVGVSGLTPLLGIFFGVRMAPHQFFRIEKLAGKLVRDLLRFTKWIFVGELSRAALASVDIFIVARLMGGEATGIYGLACNLTYLLPILTISLKAVLLPHVSRFSSRAQFEGHIRKSLRFFFLGTAAVLPLLLFSGPVISIIFGSRYAAAAPVFNVLFVADLMSSVLIVFHTAYYSLDNPIVPALADLLRLILLVFGTYKLIPVLGLMAPAVVFCLLNGLSLVGHFFYIRRLIRTSRFQ